MKVIFVGAYYYEGPVRHCYRIFEIYKAIGNISQTIGIEVKYFVKHNEVIPLHSTIAEENLNVELEDCDLLFIWNGGTNRGREITDKCRDRGIPVYFSELGWLPQQGTFYFDRKGVNYESSILDWKYRDITPHEREFLNIRLAYYHKFLAPRTGIKEDGDYVFVPLQDETDSQIIHFSPHIKKMQQLVDYISAFIPGKIIFKIHPRFDPGELIIPVHCKLYRSCTTHDFLERAQYVVTINSTVGIEALTYYKPVITLGNAFYEGRGITCKADSDAGFKEAIKWASQGQASRGVIESFLCYLFSRQWYSADLANPEKVFTLIEGITDLET